MADSAHAFQYRLILGGEIIKNRTLKILLILIVISSLGLAIVNVALFSREVEYLSRTDTESWLNIARIAWGYFTPGVGVSLKTGLNYASLGWKMTTDWDLGMHIIAILRAEEIGLIKPEGPWGSEDRLNKILDFLLTRRNTPEGVPYLWYLSDTGEPFSNASTNPSDSSRLLIALKLLLNHKPHFRDKILAYLAKTNYSYIAENEKLWGHNFYSYLDAYGFMLWGFDNSKPVMERLKDLERLESYPMVSIYGVELPRIATTSEPLILGYFDLESQAFKKYLDLVYDVQKRRYLAAGIITAWSEGGITKEPYYIYQWIVTPTAEWVTSVPETPVAFTKVALSFAAIYDDGYAKKLFKEFSKNYVNEGFIEGISESGEPTFIMGAVPYVTDKTNSMIISAAYYALKRTHLNVSEIETESYYKVITMKNPEPIYMQFEKDGDCKILQNFTNNTFDIVAIPISKSPLEMMLRWVALRYESSSDLSFRYDAYIIDEDLLIHRGPTFISHKDVLADVYRLDVPGQIILDDALRKCIMKYLENVSVPIIIFMKNPEDAGGFKLFRILELELVFSKDAPRVTYPTYVPYYILLCFNVIYVVLPLFITYVIIKQRNLSKELYISCLLTALVIRLTMAPFYAHPYDIEVWRFAARTFYEIDLVRPDLTPSPITYYTSIVGYAPYILLKLVGFRDRVYLHHTILMCENMFLKIPYIAFDFLVAYILYRLIKDHVFNPPLPPSAAALIFLFNPLSICLSSAWGLYESIGLAFLLAGLYLMLKGRYILSSIVLGLASATKLYGFLGLLPLIIYMIKAKKYTHILIAISVHLAVFISLYIPLSSWNIYEAIQHILGTTGLLGRLGLASSTDFIPGTSYMMLLQMLGLKVSPIALYIVSGVALLICTLLLVKQMRVGAESLYFVIVWMTVVFLVIYLFFFRVYPQYYLWIIPLLIVMSFKTRSPLYLILGTGLSTYISLFIVNGLTLISGEEIYIVLTELLKDSTAFNSAVSVFIILILVAIFNFRSPLLQDSRKLLAIMISSVIAMIFLTYSLLSLPA